jgi:hypothetical protein
MSQSLSAKAGTTVRRFGVAAGVLALGLVSAAPAFADWDHDHWRHRYYREGCWNCGPRVGVVVGAPVYAPPPVYYAPPPTYYAPPPVVYSPGVSLGVTIPIR